jgi:RimJ/RimL family protein N-acetyltransferase
LKILETERLALRQITTDDARAYIRRVPMASYERHGFGLYAFEAASAALAHGKRTLGLARIVAITSPDNHSSIRLLGKIGLKYERTLWLEVLGGETRLFSEGST